MNSKEANSWDLRKRRGDKDKEIAKMLDNVIETRLRGKMAAMPSTDG